MEGGEQEAGGQEPGDQENGAEIYKWAGEQLPIRMVKLLRR